MLVKFFNQAKIKNSSPKAMMDYLLRAGKYKHLDPEKAKVLRGDPRLSQAIAENIKTKTKFTAGCLSFAENELTEQELNEIIESFEDLITAGIDKDQINLCWVLHTDKDRTELNFFIPEVDLAKGTQYQPFHVRQGDKERFNAWRDIINHDYCLTDPEDPERKQATNHTLSTANVKAGKQELKTDVAIKLAELYRAKDEQGKYLHTSRDSALAALTAQGDYKTTRQGKDYVTFVEIETGKKAKAKGTLYEQSATHSELLDACNKLDALLAPPTPQNALKRLKTPSKRLSDGIDEIRANFMRMQQLKAQKNAKRHKKPEPKPEDTPSPRVQEWVRSPNTQMYFDGLEYDPKTGKPKKLTKTQLKQLEKIDDEALRNSVASALERLASNDRGTRRANAQRATTEAINTADTALSTHRARADGREQTLTRACGRLDKSKRTLDRTAKYNHANSWQPTEAQKPSEGEPSTDPSVQGPEHSIERLKQAVTHTISQSEQEIARFETNRTAVPDVTRHHRDVQGAIKRVCDSMYAEVVRHENELQAVTYEANREYNRASNKAGETSRGIQEAIELKIRRAYERSRSSGPSM